MLHGDARRAGEDGDDPLRREPPGRLGADRDRAGDRDVPGDAAPRPTSSTCRRRARSPPARRPAPRGCRSTSRPARSTCHHSAERYHDHDGALYVAQPPLREESDQDALWRGLADGSIDTVASDHAPWTRELKLDPKLDVTHSRPGVAELDTMLPLLYTEGVATGRLSLERFVALTSTNAARLFGLYPRKGTIAVGSDADLVIWETRGRRTIRDADLFSRAGHTVYAGRELTAWPRTTIRRGEVVFDGGRVVGHAGSGRPVPRRGTTPPLPPPRR